MDNQQTTDFVVRALSRHQSMSNIIQAVCEKTGMNWTEAEKFVRSVQQEKGGVIAAKQSPLILLMGGGALLVGIIMIVMVVLDLLNHSFITTRSIRLFILGILLIVGGVIGVWDTLRRLWNS